MRDVSIEVAEGDIIDIFDVNLTATNEHLQIVGYYDIAAININYNITIITNNSYYSSLITTSTEGKMYSTGQKF